MSTIGLRKDAVALGAHDPTWLRIGEEERLRVADALRGIALAVQHVGSTSVPGLQAKPIIDIAVALRDDGTAESSAIRTRMTEAGYIDRGRALDGGGWLFVREVSADVRVAHVHLVAIDDPEWNRYLTFRDALREDPVLRDRYAELKRHLAETHPDDRVAYTNAKTEFVHETVRQRAGRGSDRLLQLTTRPVAAGDGEALLELLGDPEVARWLRGAGQGGPFSRAECETIIARKLAHWAAHGFGASLAFDDGRCVGWSVVQHTRVAGRSEVEIGWAVVSDRWGQGIATEIGGQALSVARAAGFERVVAFTRVDNTASRRVMEKLGLSYERELEHAGLPHVLYATG